MKRRVLIYPDPESEYWLAECPSLPGCFSQGKTREEALKNIREAIQLFIDVLKEDGRPIPPERVETFYVQL